MSAREHDVIIIGGGINGVGVARDCALRGIKVLLLEKHDFARGASGNNTGMIHGGMRYMQYDVGTTRSSCTDSGYIQKIASHLLFRVPFIFPVFGGDKFGRLLLEGAEIFFEAYDTFQPLKKGKSHTRLTKEEALYLEPGLSHDIIGAVTLDEWGIDSFRLTLLNALDARDHGAQVRTYCEALEFERDSNGAVCGVKFYDHIQKKHETHQAPIVINATGAWGPRMASACGVNYRLRYGKGIHVVLSHRVSNYGLIMHGVDGRQMFFMPHETGTIIGTTDDDFYGDLDLPPVLDDEVSYVLEAARHVFPYIDKHRKSNSWVGVRPTIYAWGKNEDVLSREHAIIDHAQDGAPGLWSITGGKLASFRQLAQEVTDRIAKVVNVTTPCTTHEQRLPGAPKDSKPHVVQEPPTLVESRLRYRHGDVASSIESDEEVCLCEPVTKGEIIHCIRNEMAQRLCDLRGRTHLGFGACGGMHCLMKASQVVATEMQLTPSAQFLQLNEALNLGFDLRRPVLEGANLANEELFRNAYFLTANLGDHIEHAQVDADAKGGLHIAPSLTAQRFKS
jgi:glycerol-3-phosphate dehydrogenase